MTVASILDPTMISPPITALSLIELRRSLHAHPEVSGAEEATAARIAARLRALNPTSLLNGLGGHGVLATFDSGKPGPTLLFRAELDALPIVEANRFEHRSQVEGVSHKCGHDGHMAILCGLADALAARSLVRGKVHLLFQPAEETGQGAQAVLADPRFAPITPDLGFALHNMPGFPAGAVIVRTGTITAAVCSLILRFQGRTSHAMEPEAGLNPSLAIAELIQACDALNHNHPADVDFRLVTPIHVRVGSPAYGVSAGDGELHLTLRAWDDERLGRLLETILTHAHEIATRHRLCLTHEILQRFRANVNHPAAVVQVRAAAHRCGQPITDLSLPIKGGEDFGLFTSSFPGCMFLLGIGEAAPSLHSPDYDFPDSLIETGVRLFEEIVRNATNR